VKRVRVRAAGPAAAGSCRHDQEGAVARSVYITAMGPSSGKSVVTLGLMELLSRRVGRVGFFRPVIRGGAEPDNDIELIRTRYQLSQEYGDCYALTGGEVQAMTASGADEDATQAGLKTIVARFKELEHRVDFVLCEGTDFTGVSAPLEFAFNARVAGHLGCPVLVVVNGAHTDSDDVPGAVAVAAESLAPDATALGVVVNRVPPAHLDRVRLRLAEHPAPAPVWVLPDQPLLRSPTLAELGKALGAELVFGEPEDLSRVVRDVKVAAMTVPNLLPHLSEDTLLIAPGDRADVIAVAYLSRLSSGSPSPAGLVLTGGLRPEPAVVKLVEGVRSPSLAVLATDHHTYETALTVTAVEAAVTPGNERKIAAALGVFEDHVDLAELERLIEVSRTTRVTPIMFEYELVERAKADRKRIVLPEAGDDRILVAADRLLRRGVVDLTLLGSEEATLRRAGELGLDLSGIDVIDPLTSPLLQDFASTYYELRKHKAGITENLAHDLLTDVSYFGTMMVFKGIADAMVSGATHTTAHTIRPALEFIKTRPGVGIVSSVFFMCLADRVLVYGDCAVNPNPDAVQLADIAISSADTAARFGVEPRVAMLSYSTGSSGGGEDVDKVRDATALVRSRRPELKVEGPIQYDAAIDAGVAAAKLPGSEVAGHATVFVFPDLNTGNNTYKAVQRSANAVAIGPVLQGLRMPINDLSRGCTVTDIVNTVAITAVQAQDGG
jgi:phosphate acetyltransferase